MVLIDEAIEGAIRPAFDINHHFFLEQLLLYGLLSHTVRWMTTFFVYFITRQVNTGYEYSPNIIRSIRQKECICYVRGIG